MPANPDPQVITPGGSPDGHGSQGGGLLRECITPILPLPPYILDGLTDDQVTAIKIATLGYSHDVCASAAAAYKDIIAIIGK